MRTRFILSTAVADLVLLVGSLALASELTFGTPIPWNVPGIRLRVMPLLVATLVGATLLSVVTAGMSGPGVPRPSYGRGLVIVVGTLMLLSLFILLARPYWSRQLVAITFATWAVAATVHRAWRRSQPWTEPIVVVSREKDLIEHLRTAEHADVISVIDPQEESELALPPRNATLAVDLRGVLSERVARFVSSCDLAGYTVRPFASVYEEHTGRVPLVHLAEGWEISAPLLYTSPFLPGKRVFDTTAVVVTAPLWMLIGLMVAAVVRISSPGGVIFRQERIGKDERPFTMYKFRTMRADAEALGPRFASVNDPRLIRGGAFLRRTRLDEIPQLWNVLKGDMSLVGPRAEQRVFAELFRRTIPFYSHRHLVRPGITGWAQVNFEYADDEADTIDKLTYDLYYVKHMSPVLDLQVLWKSIWTVLSGAGAR